MSETSAPDTSNSDVEFEECDGPEPGMLSKDVTEGHWLLQIKVLIIGFSSCER